MNIREQIEAYAETIRPFESELFGTLYLRPIPAAEIETIQRAGAEGELAITLTLIQLALCDETGALLYAPDEREALGRLPIGLLRDLAIAIGRANGIEDADRPLARRSRSPTRSPRKRARGAGARSSSGSRSGNSSSGADISEGAAKR